MNLKKKIKIGTLVAGYNPSNGEYPGFWVGLFRNGSRLQPICNIEYNNKKDRLEVFVYENGDFDGNSVMIPITIPIEENLE